MNLRDLAQRAREAIRSAVTASLAASPAVSPIHPPEAAGNILHDEPVPSPAANSSAPPSVPTIAADLKNCRAVLCPVCHRYQVLPDGMRMPEKPLCNHGAHVVLMLKMKDKKACQEYILVAAKVEAHA